MQILTDDVALPSSSEFSDDFRDFCSKCVQKDPSQRPTAVQLLSHPFLLKHRTSSVDLRAFMATAVDPHQALDEIAFFFAHQYYSLLSRYLQSGAQATLVALAPLYHEQSSFTFRLDGSTQLTARGQDQISGRIKANMATFKGWKMSSFELKTVDCSAVPGSQGDVLLLVQGIVLGGMGNLVFTEMFMLSKQVEEAQHCCFVVSHQAFSVLPGGTRAQK
jgi:hypothetical protein